MAINFETKDPKGLLKAFKKAIDDKKVVTWKYDEDGDFTHVTSSHQWEKKAWLRPSIYEGRLTMNTVCPEGKSITRTVYAVYHGRFIESMLAHCDMLFSDARATAIATNMDSVSSNAA